MIIVVQSRIQSYTKQLRLIFREISQWIYSLFLQKLHPRCLIMLKKLPWLYILQVRYNF